MKRSLRFMVSVFIILSVCDAMALAGPAMSKGSADVGDAGIEWLSLSEAISANSREPKMIFIDFYTDWCSWCKKMDANTFADPQVAELMSNGFYAVKFNAESDQVISFKGREYGLKTDGRRPAHELAIELATYNERLGYPTFVVLDKELTKLKTFQGYKTVDALIQILDYYGNEENYKNKNWMQYIEGVDPSTEDGGSTID